MHGIERPHECGQCTHHINSSAVIGYNTRSTKEPPTEVVGYGPEVEILIVVDDEPGVAVGIIPTTMATKA